MMFENTKLAKQQNKDFMTSFCKLHVSTVTDS